MPLPQQVVDQLGKDPMKSSQTWASGAILFAGGFLALVIVVYGGMKFVYEPMLEHQINDAQAQIAAADQSISADNMQKIITYYSQVANLQSALSNHTYTSTFLSWLEKNTEANVYYQSMDIGSTNRSISLQGVGRSEADINQQIAIFESSPQVISAQLSSVALSPLGGGWSFSVTLTMQPSVFTSTMH